MFSRKEQDLLQTVFHEQVHPGDAQRVEAEWQKLFADPWLSQFEHRAATSTGERWLGWALKALRDDSGDIVEIVGVGRDVTARRLAEEQARENLHTLAHAGRLQSMGEMASSIAHELNQPLTAILSFSQASRRVIENRNFDEKELMFALERIAVNAKRAGDIISHMRSFIRKEEPRIERSDINLLIREGVELVNSELQQLEIELEYELEEALPALRVDPIQLQQVILNLVRNSMEAIQSHDVDERRIFVTTRMSGVDQIEVAVSDTGPGLDDDVAESVFDAFVTTKSDGMGIGLPICQSIIEAHDGKLIASQRAGGGAVFSFTLHADNERGEL
jgi:C4-dicarboxylate-specific signal transduction histidine kinase